MVTLIENSVNSGDISIETILSEAIEFSPNYWIHKAGIVISTKARKPKILKQAKGGYNRNYSFIVISQEGKTKPVNVHRIVAEAFIANPHSKAQVNHIDGNTDNNNASNLEWVTPAENSRHAHDLGLSPKGSKCPWSKTTESVVKEAYLLYLNGLPVKSIALTTGLTKSQIYKIIRGKQWVHVTSQMERATTILKGSTLQANGSGSAEQLLKS